MEWTEFPQNCEWKVTATGATQEIKGYKTHRYI